MTAGVTGHQNLGEEKIIAWLEKEIQAELQKLSPSHAYTSLAIGADQLFARILYKLKIPYITIIPSKNYSQTFNEKDLVIYRELLNKAGEVEVLTFDNPSEKAFLKAGETIADLSDVLFAVWNNEPSKGLGGTADIVQYAKEKNKKIIHFNPIVQSKNFINYE